MNVWLHQLLSLLSAIFARVPFELYGHLSFFESALSSEIHAREERTVFLPSMDLETCFVSSLAFHFVKLQDFQKIILLALFDQFLLVLHVLLPYVLLLFECKPSYTFFYRSITHFPMIICSDILAVNTPCSITLL